MATKNLESSHFSHRNSVFSHDPAAPHESASICAADVCGLAALQEKYADDRCWKDLMQRTNARVWQIALLHMGLPPTVRASREAKKTEAMASLHQRLVAHLCGSFACHGTSDPRLLHAASATAPANNRNVHADALKGLRLLQAFEPNLSVRGRQLLADKELQHAGFAHVNAKQYQAVTPRNEHRNLQLILWAAVDLTGVKAETIAAKLAEAGIGTYGLSYDKVAGHLAHCTQVFTDARDIDR